MVKDRRIGLAGLEGRSLPAPNFDGPSPGVGDESPGAARRGEARGLPDHLETNESTTHHAPTQIPLLRSQNSNTMAPKGKGKKSKKADDDDYWSVHLSPGCRRAS
jgi:hypothetical protein